MFETPCRKCGMVITDDHAFGSNETGWEHIGTCPISNTEIIDLFFKNVDKQIAAGELKLLLWFCPTQLHKSVEWLKMTDGRSVPICLTCYRTGTPR